ncbi:MAG TPA: NAD(P)-dependent oxidoreductase [Planctomycetota bacterium]|nr:NAD(P)-dependent oxidoreductase [Planctomycetota bacterium]
MQIALTGGTGVLGSAFVREATRRGHSLRVLTRLPGRPPIAGVEWVLGALDDLGSLTALTTGVDAIVHCAYADLDAAPPPGRSLVEYFAQTNLAGAMRLLERCPATRQKQLVFTSSLAVYGPDPRLLPRARELPLDEDFPLWPREFYGAHKAALEKLVIAGSGDLGLNTSVFRIGCLLGDYADLERDYLAKTVAEAKHGEIRSQMGAYVIADVDAASILVDAVGDERMRGKVYNCFHGWWDFSEVTRIAGELLGREVRVAAAARAPKPQPELSNARLCAERAPRWTTDLRLRELVGRLLRA